MAFADTARLIASLELQDKFTRPAANAERSLGSLEKKMSSFGSTARTALGTGLGFIGAQLVMRAAGSIFGSIRDAAIGMNATLETSTLQFETLLGSAEEAEAHVRGLFEFAAQTPFETGPIIEASRIMQTFGGLTLNSRENLTLFGDAAAATSAPIEEVAFWSSRLFAALKAGRPFGEAAQRLSELGILVPEVRTEMEDMQEAGVDGIGIWKRYQRELGRFGGAMKRQADSWQGLTSSIKDNVSLLLATSFRPIFDTAKEGMADLLAFLSTPQATAAAEQFASKLSTIINPENLREGVDTLRDLAETYGPQISDILGRIPWSSVADAARLLGTGSKALLDAFLGMPPWVQTAVLTGWGLNKLTGGFAGDIISALGTGLIKGILGLNAGVVNINAAVVNGGLGTGGTGATGGQGFNPLTALLRFAGFLGTSLFLGEATRGGGGPDVETQALMLAERLRQGQNIEDATRGITRAAIEEFLRTPALQTGLRSSETTIRLLEDLLGTSETDTKVTQQEVINRLRDREQTRSILNNLREVSDRRGQEQAGETRRLHDTLQAKKFNPAINVATNVTSNVSITDVTRRLVSQQISQGIRGGITVE